ncbi:MAG: PAS domain-containing protein [Limnobacter sp.]|nr:PAS domain-containing protein [Limnobacter sp.]
MQEQAIHLKLATSAANIGVWEYDIQTGHVQWNKVMYTMYGLHQNTQPMPLAEWENQVVKNDKPDFQQLFNPTLREDTQAAEQVLFSIRQKDTGHIKYFQAHARAIPDVNGNPSKIVGVHLDITKQKKFEKPCGKRRTSFALLLNLLPWVWPCTE